MGESPLKDAFKVLFGMALDPDGIVGVSFNFKRNIWIPRLHRNLNDWKMDEMDRLLSMVDSIRPNPWLFDD